MPMYITGPLWYPVPCQKQSSSSPENHQYGHELWDLVFLFSEKLDKFHYKNLTQVSTVFIHFPKFQLQAL